MSFWNFNRSASGLVVLLKFASSKGLDPEAVLKGTGLGPERLMLPSAEMSARQELQAAENLIRFLGEPAQTGFELGTCYHLSSYGLWGYGLISSETVGDAVTLALKFLRLTYAFTLVALTQELKGVVLTFGEPEIPAPQRDFMVARDMSAALLLLKELTGAVPDDVRMEVRRPMRRPVSLPDNVDFVSGTARNRLLLPAHLMKQGLTQSNPVTVNMCVQLLNELLTKRDATRTTVSRVKELMRVPGSSARDLASVAELLNLSQRTLRRRLAQEGVTYRSLSQEVFSQWAIELLNDPRSSITSVADQLGFADVSSFSQAFKRWTGLSPKAFRSDGTSSTV